MNTLSGTLVFRESNGAITRIVVDLGPSTVTAVLLVSAKSLPEAGSRVTVQFKESETALSLDAPDGRLSIRNRLPCTVGAIEDDGILARVNLDYSGTPLGALITSESVKDLGLSAGVSVNALIKSTEVMIGTVVS